MKKVETGTTITQKEFRSHFKRVSEDRFENVPEDVDRVVDKAPDLREHERTRGWRERLGRGSGGRRIGRKWSGRWGR